MKLEQAIHQEKKFKNEQLKAVVNVLYSASWLSNLINETLKPMQISMQQYNTLRILNGQYPNSMSVKLLTERMIDRMSNTSRLIDKLVEKGLVDRKSCPADRRKVDVTLTESGMACVTAAVELMDKKLEKKMKDFDKSDAQKLNKLLEKIRKSEK